MLPKECARYGVLPNTCRRINNNNLVHGCSKFESIVALSHADLEKSINFTFLPAAICPGVPGSRICIFSCLMLVWNKF